MNGKRIFVFAAFIMACWGATAQPETMNNLLSKGLKFSLNEDGTAFSKISLATQFWFRNTQLNDGTISPGGELLDAETDFALRRTRFSMYNNFNDRFILYTQLGFNNLHKNSSKPQLYFHDVWGMFRIVPKACYIGFGLNGWNGISRLTNTSFKKTLTLDNPGVNIPSVNHSDLEVRQLGVFVKGTAGRISYRAALSKPFTYDAVADNPAPGHGYEFPSTRLEYKGYAAFHFFDREYFNTPYLDMTYLGKKKILNLGAGFDIYPEAVAEFDASGNRTLNNRNLMAVDCFFEYPFSGKQTISLYSVFYDYDFGKNYLRRSGTMNIWNGGSGVEGAGNNEFKVGTGTIFYTVAGYLFRDDFLHLPGRLQLFYAFTEKDFEALTKAISNHDFGLNYYMAGQKLKLGFQYSLRPNIEDTINPKSQHLGTMIVQIQMVI